ncbi:MAG TPA: hypothetical protein DCG67_20105 [Pseudomonas sp.]|uniref:phage antirepressor N-terminal domain-containing protein n=1 Tax=Stutzerimonas balearica TaxID=74829 RepID=UPI000C4254D1|nr:hypothetical protein [Phycisphaerae bacterium]HAF94049.1 hypothetical protein [Pseudomonas sp.]
MTTSIDTVEFLGKALTVITTETQQLVAMRPICEGIGLNWKSQLDRIKRDEVLSQGVVMMATPSAGGEQMTACLPIELLNGWLFGVEVKRCRQAIRPALIRYKRECYAALAAYWQKNPASNDQADALVELRHRRILFTLDGYGRPQAQAVPDDAGLIRPADLHQWIEDPTMLERAELERVALAALRRLETAGGQHAIRNLLAALDPNYLLVLESELILSLYGSPAVYDKLARGGRDD